MELMLYAKSISWIDDCRIPFVDEKDPSKERYKSYRNVDNLYGGYGDTHYDYREKQGRFPANILVSDDMLNDGIISKTNTKGQIRSEKRNWNITSIMETTNMNIIQDKGTNSRYYNIDKWFDNLLESCE